MIRAILFLSCCGIGAWTAVGQDAGKVAGALTGDSKTTPENNPQCKLFTKAEAAKYIGKAVAKMSNAAGGSGCQWAGQDYDGDMLVQIVPARYHEQPTLAKGFKKLPEVGAKAFVLPEMGGWKAATLRGEESIVVTLAGPGASEKAAVDLLKETLLRKK